MRFNFRLLMGLCGLVATAGVEGGTYVLKPGDSYQVLEAAQPGDIVEIAPGTYRFRVYLTKQGSAANPVIIRAQDPANRPVWDLGGRNADQWPGSYTANDRGRGAWQINGRGYTIMNIVFRNTTNGVNAAGLRIVGGSDITIKNCLFELNDNGIAGKGENVLVEFCEMDRNGRPGSSQMTHNVYNFGGSWTIRNCYLHDPTHGQNFHLRARDALIENCWIARAKSYEGDIMPGTDPNHKLTLKGNVIIQNATPGNKNKIFDLYNDTGGTGIRMQLNLFYNTIIGNGGPACLVSIHNAGLQFGGVTASNNIVYNLKTAQANQGGSNWSFTGSNNWFPAGSDVAGLARTVFGTDPGFRNLSDDDLALLPGGAAVGKADPNAGGAAGVPGKEWYKDEVTILRYRTRSASKDLGAFESTTNTVDLGPEEVPLADTTPPLPPRNLRIVQ